MIILIFLQSSLPKGGSNTKESEDDFFEPWSSKRSGILAKYTTSEKLSITTVSYVTFKLF